MITPLRPSDADEIAALHKRIDELERKTFSNLAVTDTSGVRRLTVGTDGVTIRDSQGGIILSNNNTSGWGNNFPTTSVPMYQWNDLLDPTNQVKTVGAGYSTMWIGYFYVSHPKVQILASQQVSGGTANGGYQVTWYDPTTGIDTVMFTSAARAAGQYADNASFTLPSSTHNRIIGVRFGVRLTAGVGGVDWCAASPRGIIMMGD